MRPTRLPLLIFMAPLLLLLASGPGPGPTRAQEATPEPPWEPAGSWTAIHGPTADALWSGGEGRSARPCGIMEDRAGNRGTTPPLCAVHGQPDGAGGWIGWAVGEQGMLARYTEGAWEKVDDLDPRKTSPLTYHLHDVYVIAADDVWAVGWVEGDRSCPEQAGCGAVMHYDGSRWEMMPRSPMGIFACMERLNAIDMQYDPEHGWYGWAVGEDTACQSGGALYLGYNYDPDKPDTWRWFRVPQAARNMHDVKIHARGDVWAVGEFGIESHWYKPVSSPSWSVYGKSGADDLFSVDVADQTYGWDGGVRGRLNRYLGTCHDSDVDTQCWFDNMASPIQDESGNKVIRPIFSIDLIDRRRGWLVGQEDSRRGTIAHLYEDKRWRLVPIEGDPGKSLYGLHVIDPGWAFAVGDEGTIVEYREAGVVPETPTQSPSATPAATLTPAPSASPSPGPGSATPTPSSTPPSDTPTPVTPTALSPSATIPAPTSTVEITPTLAPGTTATPSSCDCRIHIPFALNRR